MTEVADQFTEEGSGEVTRISHWIDGSRLEGTSGRSGPVYNPALGVQTGEVDFASVEEVDAAVQAATRALESWRTVSLSRATSPFASESTLPCSSVRKRAMSSEWSCTSWRI